nr:MAG: capsid protein [Totiviridae sp.]
MSSIILDQLSGPFKDLRFESLRLCRGFKYGVHANVDFRMTSTETTQSNRHRALFTNVLSPAGRLNFVMIDDVSETSGINSRIISGEGAVEENLLLEVIRATGRVRQGEQQELALEIAAYAHECHSGVLFNLLRMQLYYETVKGQIEIGKDDVFYNDGHVAQTYRQYLGYEFDSLDRLEYNYPIEVVHALPTTKPEVGDYFVNLAGFTSDEITTLVAALSGWTTNGAIRAFSPIGNLCNRLVVPYWNRAGTMDTYDLVSLSSVKSTIRKLVFNNRLEVSFDMAYTMFCAMLYVPMPRAIEANAWVLPNHDFYIGRASSVRGVAREITGGPAYSKMPSAKLTWENYKVNPGKAALHATAYCEAVYTGLFELVSHKSDNFESTLELLGLQDAGTNSPYNFLMACAAYRFGKEFELKQTSMMGPDVVTPILNAQYGSARAIEVTAVGGTTGYALIEEKIGDRTRTRVLPRLARPALFPLLSMGVNDNRYYLNALDYTANFYANRVTQSLDFVNGNEANKLMSIFRVGGLDITVYDPKDKVYHKNWAANSNGQVMPLLNPDKNSKFGYYAEFESIVRRKNSWLKLGTLDGECQLNIKIRPVDYAFYENGKTIRSFVRKYQPVLTIPERLDEATAATFVYKTRRSLGEYYYKDFVIAETDTTRKPYVSELSDIPRSQYSERVLDQDGLDQEALEQEE